MKVRFEPDSITVEQARALNALGMRVQCWVIEQQYFDIDLDTDSREYAECHEEVHAVVAVDNFNDMRNVLNTTGARELVFSIAPDQRICATLRYNSLPDDIFHQMYDRS